MKGKILATETGRSGQMVIEKSLIKSQECLDNAQETVISHKGSAS